MNLLYSENYLIFSVFISLFLIEAGIAFLSLVDYSLYLSKMKRYLLPIWEIDGTFAVFYLVNFEATYPGLLGTVGTVFAIPVLFGGLFFILRNAFLSYSEITRKSGEERRYVTVYAISTLVIAFLVIAVLSSGVSGIGINTAAGTFNLAALLADPLALLFFIVILLVAVGSAVIYFDLRQFRASAIIALILALMTTLLAAYLYLPWVWGNISTDFALPILALIMMFLAAILSILKPSVSRYAVVALLIILINLFGIAQYPYVLGGSNINNYINNHVIGQYVVLITTAGGILVLASLAYMFHLGHKNGHPSAVSKNKTK